VSLAEKHGITAGSMELQQEAWNYSRKALQKVEDGSIKVNVCGVSIEGYYEGKSKKKVYQRTVKYSN
jgi:hypothetical protein